MSMKKITALIIFLLFLSCIKDNNSTQVRSETDRKTDSINNFRTKYNDSITVLNAKNHFRDLSGNHILKHSSFSKNGNAVFQNTGRDLYKVSGGIKSGKNYVKIEGEIKMVSEEFLNFTGKITQSISENENGKVDVRDKKTIFAKKGNQKYWRLQNRMNDAGFTDDIDLY